MKEKITFMSELDFHTIREPIVLVFSVLNVSELICRLTHTRKLKKQCIYMQDRLSKSPLKFFFLVVMPF